MYRHIVGPRYGGLGVDDLPCLPIKDRQRGLIGQVITQDQTLDLLAIADLKSKSRFKGAKDGITIRS